MEQWKQIEDYEHYEVSTEGRVKNKKGEILKARKNEHGYLYVSLWKNNKGKNFRVNRLVAIAFIPNPNNYTDVNHINEDKTDNRVENLEWLPHGENIKHGTLQQKKEEKLKGNTYHNTPVRCIETGQEFESVKQASEWLNVRPTSLTKHLRGQRKSIKKYHFEYVSKN